MASLFNPILYVEILKHRKVTWFAQCSNMIRQCHLAKDAEKSLTCLHFDFITWETIMLGQVDSSKYFNSKRPITPSEFNSLSRNKKFPSWCSI